ASWSVFATMATPSYAPALSPGTTYFWRVTASNNSGSTVGPWWSFKTADAATVDDVVVYASEVPHSALHGWWTFWNDWTSPAGWKLATGEGGFAAPSDALAAPTHFVDVTFDAPAGVPYTLWLRLQAAGNSKYNDSVWVQFSDALVNGIQVYPLNSA